MTIDDFEWMPQGFDEHVLMHKTHVMTIASLVHFSGWKVVVLKPPKGIERIAEHIDNFEAAKVIALIYVNQHMEGYPDAKNYLARTIRAGPPALQKGVFRVG